jgi:3-dehydroquinate dehydratase/shikimate dehydrogenase
LSAKVCLSLAASTLEENQRIAAEYRQWTDLLELRVDGLAADEAAAAARFPRMVDQPVILTVRRRADGGEFAGSEAERVGLLGKLAGAGFSMIELEEDLRAAELEARCCEAHVRIIRSLHDFSGVPPDLTARLSRLAHGPAELPKAVVMVRGQADHLRLLACFEELSGMEKIILGIGDPGFPSRVLASRLGSTLCYTGAASSPATPGQIDPRSLSEVYRFRAIGPTTEVFGVIGDPIMHSRSPRIHNVGLALRGLDAVYLPFLVDDLEPFWAVADSLGIRGLSVTAPHKQAVAAHLAARDALVDAVGACNTMTRPGPFGGWTGTNTDVDGFLRPLRAALVDAPLRGLAATVIGAGGAARAVVHALAREGARVLVLNRSPARGRALASDFGAESAGLDEEGYARAAGYADIVVQSTSAGMEPETGVDPAPGLAFSGREIVYELVYAPAATRFLSRARAAGCRTIPGMRMLLAQAAEQFRLFTGSELPPTDEPE